MELELSSFITSININNKNLTIGSEFIAQYDDKIFEAKLTDIYNDEEIYIKNLNNNEELFIDIQDLKILDITSLTDLKSLYFNNIYTISNDLIKAIVGRNDLKDVINNIDINNTVIISITDPKSKKIDINLLNKFNNSLSLSFWDVEEDFGDYKIISNNQAHIIKNFILDNKDKSFVIHCEAGQSRSAGIGLAIECLINFNGSKENHIVAYSPIKGHPRYKPNKTIYETIIS